MKILLVEDNPASIRNARSQLVGHELTVVTTMFEFLAVCNAKSGQGEYQFPSDVVVTDVNVPMGNARSLSVGEHYSQTMQVPVGLVVVMAALVKHVPCYVITDSNSHRDPIGILLDSMPPNSQILSLNTRPLKLTNQGKDYEEVLEWIRAHQAKLSKKRSSRKH